MLQESVISHCASLKGNLVKFASTALLACVGFNPLFASSTGNSNVDTPNLNFGSGNFSNWQLYTGWYHLNVDDADSVGSYDWEEHEWGGLSDDKRFYLQASQSDDDVVACDDFKKVPTDLYSAGQITARIGNPMYVEGQSHDRPASEGMAGAERMVYTFTVTENTTLLNYRYACVLKDPADSKNPHNDLQRPSFIVKVSVLDPMTDESVVLPYSDFMATADPDSSNLTQNSDCAASSASRPTDYFFKNWTSVSVDLRNYIGKQVTIEIINHDCLTTDYYYAGSHDAYGYFWAETRKLELATRSCKEEDATITAPCGFDSYKWSRSDSGTIVVDSLNPQIATIPYESLADSVSYSCVMSNAGSDSAAVELTTSVSVREPVLVMAFLEPDLTSIIPDFQLARIGDSIVLFTFSYDSVACYVRGIDPDTREQYKYTWSTGDTTNYIVLSSKDSTIYSVYGTDSYGCRSELQKFTLAVDTTPVTGINLVKTAAKPLSGKIYDLSGREVKNLQFDRVYIQDGKKFILRK